MKTRPKRRTPRKSTLIPRRGCRVELWSTSDGIEALIFDPQRRGILAITARDITNLVRAGILHPALLNPDHATPRERAAARRSVLDHLVAAGVLAG